MSVVSTLIYYNIPFRFENLNAIVEPEYTNQLIKNFIPFKFKDGKIVLIEKSFGPVTKKDALQNEYGKSLWTSFNGHLETLNRSIIERQMDTFAETIRDVLEKSQKFSCIGTIKDEKYRKNTHIQYKGQMCMIEVYTDKILLKYTDTELTTYKWTLTLNFKSPLPNINYLLPKLKDGFVLMVIAGFDYQITPLNWTSFEYKNDENNTSCTVKWVNDTEPYFLISPDDLKIKNLNIMIAYCSDLLLNDAQNNLSNLRKILCYDAIITRIK
jgi:hypothetical protein